MAYSPTLMRENMANSRRLGTPRYERSAAHPAVTVAPARAAFERGLTGRGFRPVATVALAHFRNDAGLIGAADLARHSIVEPPGPARGFWPRRRGRPRSSRLQVRIRELMEQPRGRIN